MKHIRNGEELEPFIRHLNDRTVPNRIVIPLEAGIKSKPKIEKRHKGMTLSLKPFLFIDKDETLKFKSDVVRFKNNSIYNNIVLVMLGLLLYYDFQ